VIYVNVEVLDLEPMPESQVRVRSPSPVDQSALREKLAGKARADDWLARMRAELSRARPWPSSSYREFAARFDPYSTVYNGWFYDPYVMPES